MAAVLRFQKIVKYVNLDDLSRRVKPYCLRRLKAECLDLPAKLFTVREVALTAASWARYDQLRKEAIIALEGGDVRLEPNAAVRIMRLAQLTSGILNGAGCDDVSIRVGDKEISRSPLPYLDISSEKLDWAVQYLTEECTAQYVIVWCRWRRERERLVEEFLQKNNLWLPKSSSDIRRATQKR